MLSLTSSFFLSYRAPGTVQQFSWQLIRFLFHTVMGRWLSVSESNDGTKIKKVWEKVSSAAVINTHTKTLLASLRAWEREPDQSWDPVQTEQTRSCDPSSARSFTLKKKKKKKKKSVQPGTKSQAFHSSPGCLVTSWLSCPSPRWRVSHHCNNLLSGNFIIIILLFFVFFFYIIYFFGGLTTKSTNSWHVRPSLPHENLVRFLSSFIFFLFFFFFYKSKPKQKRREESTVRAVKNIQESSWYIKAEKVFYHQNILVACHTTRSDLLSLNDVCYSVGGGGRWLHVVFA